MTIEYRLAIQWGGIAANIIGMEHRMLGEVPLENAEALRKEMLSCFGTDLDGVQIQQREVGAWSPVAIEEPEATDD